MPDYEGVIKSGQPEIKRPGSAYGVRRVGFDHVANSERVQPLKMERFIWLKASEFLERGDRLVIIAFAHRSLDQRVQRRDEVMVLADAKEDLRQPFESADMIDFLVEQAAEKVYCLVLFALGY